MMNRLTALGVSFLAVGLFAVIAPNAHAEAAAQPPTSGNFCVSYLPTGKTVCVASEDDMPAARQAVLVSATTTDSADSAATVVHIATLYDNDQYNTAAGYYEITTSADCTASKTDANWQNSNLAAIGWSNRVSSFHSYGNCQTRLFANTSFGGTTYPTTGYVADSPNLGTSMNDNAESVKWT